MFKALFILTVLTVMNWSKGFAMCDETIKNEGVSAVPPSNEIVLQIPSFDGAKLTGVLNLSPTDKALAITVHGSFAQDRNGDLDEKQKWMFPQGVPKRGIFKDVARVLSGVGIGSFRYDKRASGESEGVYEDADIDAFAKDLIAIQSHLRLHYPKMPIIIVAQSEGAITTLRAFQLGLRPDFMVLQGPALVPMEVWMEFQKTRAAAPFLRDLNGPQAHRLPYLAALYDAYFNGDMKERIDASNDPHYQLKIGDWTGVTSLSRYRQYGQQGTEILKSVTCPVALIIGEQDQNIPPDSVREIEKAKAQGLYSNVDTYVLPGLEHSFREMLPGDSFVEVMAKPLSPLYTDALLDFVEREITHKN